jgi:hypothetical protein
LCFAAGGADAAPAPQLFRLTISATTVAAFDHTGASVAHVDCESSLRAVGVRTAVFRSARPLLVRFVDGRLQPIVLRRLRGTVKLSGANTGNEVCASGGETHRPELCSRTTRTFENARVLFRSTAPGSISIATPHVALHRSRCPREPNEVAALPLGQAPGPIHVSQALLDNSRIKRITLTARASRTKHYGDPEAGILREQTAWKLTLVRTGR